MADDLRALMEQAAAEQEHDQETFGENLLGALADAAREFLAEKAEVARLEGELSDAKKRVKELEEKRIPALMEEIGVKEFKLDDGSEIKTKEEVYCSLPKEREAEGFTWLEANGHGSIIKHVIACEFGKGEGEEVAKLRELLDEASLPYKDRESVHPSTLRSWAREEIENGRFPPDDIFNVYEATVAKVKPAK